MTPPESSSPLRLLHPPPRLRIPLATRRPVDAPHPAPPPPSPPSASPPPPPGPTCRKGAPLPAPPPEPGPAALAPTSGRVIGTGTATLTSGHEVPAVELEPDFEDQALPPDPAHAEPPVDVDKATPDDF